jgi:hypothetical protein
VAVFHFIFIYKVSREYTKCTLRSSRDLFCLNYRVYIEMDLLDLIFCVLMPLSAISWRPVLVVEEAGVHGENHRPWASMDLLE